jgi:hypothetical protein
MTMGPSCTQEGGFMNRALIAALAAALTATAAVGQTPSSPPSAPRGNSQGSGAVIPQPGPVMSEGEIKDRLKEEGYTEVTELQLQGPSYEAKALKDGRKYNLTVDARTGAIRSRY